MTDPVKFPGFQECEKQDPCTIAAYVELRLDPENPTGIILSSSWGDIPLDLKSIVKNGETITHLELAPEDDPTVVRYFREDGEIDCITGNELSRIISLQLLKDVDQTNPPSDGIVYQYDEATGLFQPFDLKTFVSNTNTALGRLQASITNLQNQINALDTRITAIETPPEGTPSDAVIAWGNRNIYGDVSNTNSHAHGVFTHNPSTDLVDDQYFS